MCTYVCVYRIVASGKCHSVNRGGGYYRVFPLSLPENRYELCARPRGDDFCRYIYRVAPLEMIILNFNEVSAGNGVLSCFRFRM